MKRRHFATEITPPAPERSRAPFPLVTQRDLGSFPGTMVGSVETRPLRSNQKLAVPSVNRASCAAGIHVWSPHTAVKLDVLCRPSGPGTALSRLLLSARRRPDP